MLLPFLLLLSLPLFAQYKIVDAANQQPVSYAHVTLANTSTGVLANFEGVFMLTSRFKPTDTLEISCIGYETKTVLVKNLNTQLPIRLQPIAEQLEEVVVRTKKIKYRTKKLGVTRTGTNSGFADYPGVADNGEIRASYIPNEYSTKGILKAVNVHVSELGYPDAHFRVHVYDCSLLETKPGKELTKSNLVVAGTEGDEWVHIDMREEKISVSENGCFIGIEWFDSPKSKHYLDTVKRDGFTYKNGATKDTVYTRIRKGNGAVISSRYEKFKYSKNKLWYLKEAGWMSPNFDIEKRFNVPYTLPSGQVIVSNENNFYSGILCINIEVDFPKTKNNSSFEDAKKRKLNRIARVKENQFKYPQGNVSELFSSLIKAFENNEVVYVLKYLCVYEDDQQEELLEDLNTDAGAENLISETERKEIIASLHQLKNQLPNAEIKKLDYHAFEIVSNQANYRFLVEGGLWKINPYGHRITK